MDISFYLMITMKITRRRRGREREWKRWRSARLRSIRLKKISSDIHLLPNCLDGYKKNVYKEIHHQTVINIMCLSFIFTYYIYVYVYCCWRFRWMSRLKIHNLETLSTVPESNLFIYQFFSLSPPFLRDVMEPFMCVHSSGKTQYARKKCWEIHLFQFDCCIYTSNNLRYKTVLDIM